MNPVCTLIFCKEQADTRNCSGSVCLDINLLKPSRVELVDEPAPLLCISDTQACPPKWLEYIYRTAHPILRWLPTKLAEWIGENLQDVLGFPDKADQRAEPGSGWTPAELNNILTAHVVDGAVTTFGCVEWESQLFRGVMRARCYPFNLPKRRFHSFNPQVHCTLIHIGTYQYVRFTYLYIPCLYEYVQQYTKNDIVALLLHRILF
jgi:hypothetical protein